MAAYKEYDDALKKKDQWGTWYKSCCKMSGELVKYAVGNGGDSARYKLEKAYEKIVSGEDWAGEDARECALLIWEIRNETVSMCNRFSEICDVMKEYALEKQHEWIRIADEKKAEMDLLGQGEGLIRATVFGDMRR